MVKQIPEHIDPFKFADQGECLVGKVQVAELERLVNNLASPSGAIDFVINFGRSDRARIATGSFKAVIEMSCQRCLKPVQQELNEEIKVEFVLGADTQGRLEDQGYETVPFEETLALKDLIEDEVLLALPFSPLHEEQDCEASKKIEQLQETTRPNPFAVLAKLKIDQE